MRDEDVATGDDVPEPGPYGPGSAPPRRDGSGPEGWSVKATHDGNVFHTEDSPAWRATEADVWFDDVSSAREAGFDHWDPYQRTDLEAGGPDVPRAVRVDAANGDDPGSSPTPMPAGAPTTTSADHEVPGDDLVDRVADGSHEAGPAGPYGPGSARPAVGGAGPDGWEVKATATGTVFHTPESPTYDDVHADAWFVDVEHAEVAGFHRWDRAARSDVAVDDGSGRADDRRDRSDEPTADEPSTDEGGQAGDDPAPVGGTLARDDGPSNPQRTTKPARGFGALDTHEREPVADLPDTTSDDDVDEGPDGDDAEGPDRDPDPGSDASPQDAATADEQAEAGA